jgi:hypothetical protein
MIELFLINTGAIVAAVFIHYEVLQQLSRFLPRMPLGFRFRIAVGVLGAMLAHTMEVWLFALVFHVQVQNGSYGTILGVDHPDLMGCVYFSFTTYTSLGYGDLVPVGDLRYLAGLEALTGLVFIAWTASFLYFEMQRYWHSD